jgi:Ca-activated chloride channel family protein
MKRMNLIRDWRHGVLNLPVIITAALVVAGCRSGPLICPPPYSGGGTQPSQTVAASGTEELWIIGRSYTTRVNRQSDKNLVGTGELLAKEDQQPMPIPLPLKHTEVRAAVSGCVGTVDVKQEFANPYQKKIEAVYVFPLPHDAAVNEFVMTIGDRHIRGIIRGRAEAEGIYAQAKSLGYTASLLTEERPNIFSQSVANIEPGKEIDVNIKYFQTLAYNDGWYEFVFPMVVGPRYNPTGTANGVGAVERGNAGASGQSTEAEYLKPGERSGHDIALHLDVNSGVKIEEFQCATHRIVQKQADDKHLSVALAADDRIPNKDFVLRYRLAGKRVKSELLTHRDERGGYFALMLYPPKDLAELPRAPVEMVFVLDCSGSMSGAPILQAKTAILRALDHLQSGDTFQIINFSEHASQLGKKPLAATPENIQKGRDYVTQLNGDGPTEMIEGVRAALDFDHDPGRVRFVCFLTDGYIGNEAQILAAVHERLGEARIFSFGVGSSSNRYLLDALAKMGSGAAAYPGLHDDAARVMDDFFACISHPALTDARIDWGGMQPAEINPPRMPDLFTGRPVMLTGRFSGHGETTLRITGRAGGQRVEMQLPANLSSEEPASKALPAIWARGKIAGLAERMTYEQNAELPMAIRQVALDYSLMSAYTAFIAVDASRTTQGNEGVTMKVPVPAPEGVDYKKTVKEKEQ